MPAVVRKRERISVLMDAVGPSSPVRGAVKKALNVLETAGPLSQASFPTSGLDIRGVELEEDAELPSWKYAVIRVSLAGVPDAQRSEAERLLVESLYSQLDAHEATKVLLEFV